MKGSIAAAAAGALAIPLALSSGSASVLAQEFPSYERDGYPLTALQLQVLGSNRVQESPPASTLEREGMPASPHQLAVLRRTNGAEH